MARMKRELKLKVKPVKKHEVKRGFKRNDLENHKASDKIENMGQQERMKLLIKTMKRALIVGAVIILMSLIFLTLLLSSYVSIGEMS